MNCSFLLTLGILVVCAQQDDETKRALAAIQKVKGTVVIDHKAPGQPVVSVNL